MKLTGPVALGVSLALGCLTTAQVLTFNGATDKGLKAVTPGAGLAALTSGPITPVNGGPLTPTVVTIDNQAGYQVEPRVSGDLACYTDSELSQLRYYRFSTATNHVVADGAQCSIEGTRIAYSDLAGPDNQIRVFDVSTSTSITVDYQAGARRYETAIAGNTVAFFDYFFPSPFVYTSTTLRVADLSSPNQSQVMSSLGVIERNVKISPAGDVLVWETPDANNYSDITKAVRVAGAWGAPQASTNTAFISEESPATDGQYIVWSSVDDGSISFQAVGGGATTQLAIPGLSYTPGISHGVIAFRHDNWDATGTTSLPGDIMIYVIATNTLYQLTNTPTVSEDRPDIEVLSTGGWRVVWQTFDANFSNPDISGTTMNPPNSNAAALSNLGSTPNPSVLGQVVSFSVSVTGSAPLAGNVAFYDNGIEFGQASVTAGVATVSYGGLSVGVHGNITAQYLGDPNGNLASPPTLPISQTVNPYASSIVVTSQPNPSIAGQSVGVTATVIGMGASGSVTFSVDGSQMAGTFPLSPQTSITATATISISTLTVGSHVITAHYGGDANNTASDTVPPQWTHTVLVDRSSGTATKAIAPGQPDRFDSHFGRDSAADNSAPLTAFSHAGATLPVPLPQVNAYGLTSTSATAGARAIAYAPIVVNAGPSFQANAVLSGMFGTVGSGQVIAAIYVFDPTDFLNTIDNSGMTLDQFLFGADDTVAGYAAGDPAKISLGRSGLFPGAALKASAFQPFRWTPQFPDQIVHTSQTPAIAGQRFIVVFDIIVYAPADSLVNFADTFKAAPVFLTDPSGNPVPYTALGPWAPTPPPVDNLTVGPSSTTNPLTTPVTVTAMATTAAGLPVPDTNVFFDIIAGPNAQPLGPITTDANGQASVTYSGGTAIGTDQIQAHVGTRQSNVAQITWTPGPLDHIAITPATATIAAGGSQSYTAQSFDAFDNSIANVTNSTAFSISPDGSCAGASCTASVAGTHTVSANYNGRTATATLEVTGTSQTTFTFHGFFAPIDMSTSSTLVWNTVKAGQAIPVKWLLTLNGTPVSNATSFGGLVSYQIACSSGAGTVEDAIDQTATGSSGLQYNGAGNWQFNWQTLSAYKGTCRAVVVKFSDGTMSPPVNFKFK
jgi:hypothetical protein